MHQITFPGEAVRQSDPIARTGELSWSLPLDLPSGVNGSGPNLELTYAGSSGGLGSFGRGFTLGVPSITKRDTYLSLSSIGELVEVSMGEYRPKFAADHCVVLAHGSGWLVQYPDGRQEYYEPFGTKTYLMSRQITADGHESDFEYGQDGLLEQVTWAIYTVQLVYENRPDPYVGCSSGQAITVERRCAEIALAVQQQESVSTVRKYAFEYALVAQQSHVERIFRIDGSSGSEEILQLEWTGSQAAALFLSDTATTVTLPRDARPLQFRGRGRTDFWAPNADGIEVYLSNGRTEISRPVAVPNAPAEMTQYADRVGFGDVKGRGRRDLLVLAPASKGVYQINSDGTFGEFEDWSGHAPQELLSPRSTLVDVDGDGVSDLLVIDASASEFRAYLPEDGRWGARAETREMGEHWIDIEADGRVTNISGGRHPDLVRIRPQGLEVAYGLDLLEWSPWTEVEIELPEGIEDLNEVEVFFSDLTGNGVVDLVAKYSGGIAVWIGTGHTFNLLGVVRDVRLDDEVTLELDDFEGRGYSQILIWSNEILPLVIDLWGGTPPGLLSTMDNKIGLSTQVSYASTAELDTGWSVGLASARTVVKHRIIEDVTDGSIWDQKFEYSEPYLATAPRPTFFFGEVLVREPESQSVAGRKVLFSRYVPKRHGEIDGLEATKAGMLNHAAIYDSEDEPLVRHANTWDIHSRHGAYQARLSVNTRELIDREGNIAQATVQKVVSFDVNGNALNTEAIATADRDMRRLVSNTVYLDDPTNRYRDRPVAIEQIDGNDGAILSKTRFYYDGKEYGNIGAKGLISKVETLVMTDTDATRWFGDVHPESLGYFRVNGESGWWRTSKSIKRRENTIVSTDPLGHATQFNFDDAGLFVVESEDALGKRVEYEIDYATARPKTIVDQAGFRRDQEFDDAGRLSAVYQRPFTAPIVRYSMLDRVTVAEHKFGSDDMENRQEYVYERSYSGTGQVYKVLRKPAGQPATPGLVEELVRRGGRGHAISRAVPHQENLGSETEQYTFDALDRVVEKRAANGVRRHLEWDGLFLKIHRLEDEAWIPERRMKFDALVRPSEIVEGDGADASKLQMEYDLRGNATTITDALGRKTAYDFDLLGRKVRIVCPDRGASTFLLDAADNVTATKRVDIGDVNYAFAADGQLTDVSVSDGEHTSTVYGSHTAPGSSQPVSIDYPAGREIRSYTHDGKLRSAQFFARDGIASLENEFVYRPDGQIKEIIYRDLNTRDNVHIRYEYDKFGRLLRIPNIIKHIEYSESGTISKLTHANGVVTSLEYAPDTRSILGIEVHNGASEQLFSEQYAFDQAGRVNEITNSRYGSASIQRDGVGQVVEVTRADGQSHSFCYDALGNIQQRDGVNYEYAGDHTLSKVGDEEIFTDGGGRITRLGGHTYQYDAANQLKSTDGPHGSARYYHDHQGHSILALSSSGDLQSFAPSQRLLATAQGSFGMVVLNNQVVAVFSLTNRSAKYLHANFRGDIVLATAEDGSVVEQLSFDPFGDGEPQNIPLGFEAKTWDPIGRIYDFGARPYSPALGRFLTPDPLVADVSDPLSMQRYAYARNDPYAYRDPSGLLFDWIADVGDWIGDHIVEIIAVAVIVVTIVATGGAAAVLWGMAIGGAVGGLAAAAAGENVLRGILVGAALGGLGAWGAMEASAAVFGSGGASGLWGFVAQGALKGSIHGAALGLATGIASGDDVGGSLEKMALGAVTGAIVGAAFGAAQYGADQWLAKPGRYTTGSEFKKGLEVDLAKSFKSANGNFARAGEDFAGKAISRGVRAAAESPAAKQFLSTGAEYVFSDAGYVVFTQGTTGYVLIDPNVVEGLLPGEVDVKGKWKWEF